MISLKFQRIRFCVQCKEPLPLKCKGCLLHPERKPKIVELYDWPTILKVGPCGCLLIACQAPGCKNTKWRYSKLHAKEGKATSKTFCCSKQCASLVASNAKKTSVQVPCSHCGKPVMRQQSILKMNRYVYCNPEHCYLHRRSEEFQKFQAKRILEKQARVEAEKLQLLECHGNCKEIAEHTEIKPGRYKCNSCGHLREAVVFYNKKAMLEENRRLEAIQ